MAKTGTFEGHVLPGTFFLVYGFWWTFHITRIYIIHNNDHYSVLVNRPRSSKKYSRCLCYVFIQKAQLFEGVTKVLATLVGALLEANSASWEMVDDKNRFHGQNNWHHVTMYMFFGFSGIVDVLSQTCVRLAPGRDKLYLSIAFAAEGFLFYLHSSGSKPLDAILHKLLVLAIFGGAISTFFEMWLVKQRFLPFFRVAFILLQGTWFYQIAFTLFDPRSGDIKWDEQNRVNVAFIVMSFTWHCLGVVIFLNVVYGSMALFYWCKYGKGKKTDINEKEIVGNSFELVVENKKLLDSDNDNDEE
ncbi:transmembrane protein 45B-like [Glandiceps talaboti]